MPTVRLSGSICETDPQSKREIRAYLLYLLFRDGWDIYNSNGDQRITLSNIEGKIMESDAFAFMPDPMLEDLFKVTSIFVGYQTLDRYLDGKPTVIMNGNGSWQPYFALLTHLQNKGTIRQDVGQFLTLVDSADALGTELSSSLGQELPDAGREVVAEEKSESYECAPDEDLLFNVCVFCSATIEKKGYLDDGYAFGKQLAEANIGCVSGAGKSGVMGQVVSGASDGGGWTGGSNVPHIIALEGLPEDLDCFWPRPDIYTRMEVMIQNSDAFVAFPGGSGTVQEVLALLILHQQGDALMEGKPIVLYNRIDEDGIPFWDPLIKLLEEQGVGHLITSVQQLDEVLPALVTAREKSHQ
ncbi:MAG: LOG family protein [Verrucomicrobiales bacterium]